MSMNSLARPVKSSEQPEPDQQQEVPVGGAELDAEPQPLRPAEAPGAGQGAGERDEAAEDVQAVQRRSAGRRSSSAGLLGQQVAAGG